MVEPERFVDKKMFSWALKRPGNANPMSPASKTPAKVAKADDNCKS